MVNYSISHKIVSFFIEKKICMPFFFLTETYNLFSEKRERKVLPKPSHSFFMIFFLRFAKTYLLCGKKTKHISYVMSFRTWVFSRVVTQFPKTRVSPKRKTWNYIYIYYFKLNNEKKKKNIFHWTATRFIIDIQRGVIATSPSSSKN